jgi:glyoxylase-like metal-dependent hydrolase (beta-lactamase superfamily II)/rhodanese-related sulfurtransferase
VKEVPVATVVTIETPELGDRSYLVHDGELALVIDPQRDIDRVLAAADEAGVRIAAIAETHLHNDYVTGGLALAGATGADYLVAAADEVGFDRHPVADGDEVKVGAMVVQVLATPGHTPHHLSYVVHVDGRPEAVFTGGSLLYGTVGRTDLIGPEMTEELTRAQWRSAHRLAAELPADIAVYPTHGFGSFCSSAKSTAVASGTLADEVRGNLALQIDDEDRFVSVLLAGLTAYPRYYAHMGPLNRQGPPPVSLDPPAAVDVEELGRRLRAGEWVVDLRSRRAYAARHLAGTVGIELGTLFATYLGWVLPWDAPITVIGDTEAEVLAAQRQLVRIGIDQLAGAATGGLDALAGAAPTRGYRVSDFAGLAAAGVASGAGGTILDVRRDDERAGGYITGSVHIPLQDLLDRLDEVPDGELWVHCAAGFRASIAASLLDRAGRQVVLVDDDYGRAAAAGLPMTQP